MTAEVAILNKLGVALAADSAATITTRNGPKTYNSANKLFSVSKFHPVGAMIWGSSEINTVPWEIIIKQYRENLGRRAFGSVEDYLKDMLRFLENEVPIGEKEQRKNIEALARIFFLEIRQELNESYVRGILEKKRPPTNAERYKVFRLIISARKVRIAKCKKCDSLIDVSEKNILSEYREIITSVIKGVTGDDKLPAKLVDEAISVFANQVLSEQLSNYRSGLVIAGYGKMDYFPSLKSVQTDGFFLNRCKIINHKSIFISEDNSASIVPFAQRDVVDTFISGVNNDYERRIRDCVRVLVEKAPSVILDQVSFEEDDKLRSAIERKCSSAIKKMLESFSKDLDRYKRKHFITPLIEAVAFLGKDELAVFAENLVNLTALKRKVSLNAETVGGPIDVAVISRNDGLIWMKRKHYFDPRLNQFFFRKYLNSNVDCDILTQRAEGEFDEKND